MRLCLQCITTNNNATVQRGLQKIINGSGETDGLVPDACLVERDNANELVVEGFVGGRLHVNTVVFLLAAGFGDKNPESYDILPDNFRIMSEAVLDSHDTSAKLMGSEEVELQEHILDVNKIRGELAELSKLDDPYIAQRKFLLDLIINMEQEIYPDEPCCSCRCSCM